MWKALLAALSVMILLNSCMRMEMEDGILYFISDYQVYSILTDGTGLKRLTDDTRFYSTVNSSMDGDKILISTDADMYLMDYDGGVPVFFRKGAYGTYGPSGKVYFVENKETIMRCDSGGGNAVQLYQIPGTTIYDLSCNYNETLLAVGHNPDFSGRTARLTIATSQYVEFHATTNIQPTFSPVNNDMVGVGSSSQWVGLYHPDNSFEELVSLLGVSNRVAWSVDGEYIYYTYNNVSPKEIRRMRRDGTETEVIALFDGALISCLSIHGKPR